MAQAGLHEDNSRRILVVDAAPCTRHRLALQLAHAGYAVLATAREDAARAAIRRDGAPQLILLDLGLPDLDATTLRSLGPAPLVGTMTPVAMAVLGEELLGAVTARLVKPISYAELVTAVQQVLSGGKTAAMPDGEIVIDAGVTVDFGRHTLAVHGAQIALTPIETRLLHLLYLNRGRVVSPGYLMSQAWRDDQRGTLGSLWVHIRRLRNKLEPEPATPRYLLTVRGQGYRLEA